MASARRPNPPDARLAHMAYSVWGPGRRRSQPPRGRVIAPLVVATAMISFQVSFPLQYWFFGADPTLTTLEGLASVPVMLFALDGLRVLGRTRVCLHPFAAFGLLVAWILLGTIFVPPTEMRSLVTPISHLLVMCGMAGLFGRYWPSIVTRFTLMFYALCAIFAFWMLAAFLSENVRRLAWDEDRGLERFVVGDVPPTALAALLWLLLCLALFLLRARRGPRVLNLAVVLGCAILMFMVAGSRAALVGAAAVYCLFILAGPLRRAVRLLAVTAVIIVATAGVLLPYYSNVAEHIGLSLSGGTGGDEVRPEIYRMSLRWALENPAFGIGYGNFKFPIYVWGLGMTYRNAHQNLLGLAAESGFPAALLYLVFTIFTLRALWVRGPSPGTPPLVAHAVFFVQACLWIFVFLQVRGLVHYNWYVKPLAFVVGAGLGARAYVESKTPPRRAVRPACREGPGADGFVKGVVL